MVHIKLIILVYFGALLSSCIYIREIPKHPQISLQDRVKESNSYRQYRALEAESFNLDEKEFYFFTRFQDKFLIKPEYLAKRYHYKNNKNITAYTDETAFYLAYLSLKSKKSPIDLEYYTEAIQIINALYYLDNLNNLDGFLPRFINLKNDVFSIAKEPIRTNSYSILFFSYYLAYNAFDDPEIKKLILEHTKLIIKYFIKHDLDLKDPKGKKIKYSSLKSNINLSRQLDALVIFEVANHIINNSTKTNALKQLKQQIAKKLLYFKNKGYYHNNKIMFPSLGFWEFSSHSSNWLNLLKLYTLAKSTDNSIYKTMFKKLYKNLESANNSFFTLLYANLFPIESSQLTQVKKTLSSYPLLLNNHEIINSQNKEIKLKRFPKIIKNRRYTESQEPLAIYDRPLVYFEWKRNQHRVDGNFGQKGNIEYSGLDFLLAYALLNSAKTLN